MFLPEEIMRRKVVTSKLAMSTAADFDLLICRYIQIKEVKVKLALKFVKLISGQSRCEQIIKLLMCRSKIFAPIVR